MFPMFLPTCLKSWCIVSKSYNTTSEPASSPGYMNLSSAIRNVFSCLSVEYHICVSGLRLFVWRLRWSNVWSKGQLKSLEPGEVSTKIRLSHYYRIAVKWWLELCQAGANQPKTWSRSLRYRLVCRSIQNIGGYLEKNSSLSNLVVH